MKTLTFNTKYFLSALFSFGIAAAIITGNLSYIKFTGALNEMGTFFLSLIAAVIFTIGTFKK